MTIRLPNDPKLVEVRIGAWTCNMTDEMCIASARRKASIEFRIQSVLCIAVILTGLALFFLAARS